MDFEWENPDFWWPNYQTGKRGYKTFRCVVCMKPTRVDKMKLKSVWKCNSCIKDPSGTQRDKRGKKQVSECS